MQEVITTMDISVRHPTPLSDEVTDEVIDVIDDLLWLDDLAEAVERKLQSAVIKATGLKGITFHARERREMHY